MKPFTVPTRT